MYLFLRFIVSEKISDTFGIKFSTLHFLTPLHELSTRPTSHITWVPKSPPYGPQKIHCLFPFNKGWFELRKTPYLIIVWFHSVGDDLNWGKLPIVCLSVWFHLISLFSESNHFRAKMYRTLNIDIFIRYNFCGQYFFPRSIFIDIKWKNFLKTFFFNFDLENQICG